MVCNVLCKNNQSNRQESDNNFCNTATGQQFCIAVSVQNFSRHSAVNQFVQSTENSQFRNTEDGFNTTEGTICQEEVIDNRLEVDDHQIIRLGSHTDEGKDSSNSIACNDTQDEGNQASHLVALLRGTDNNDKECDQTAQ